MLIRVFGNTYLNPDVVGKLDMDVTIHDDMRTTITRVFDATGQHVLLDAATTVAVGSELSEQGLQAVRRDNEVHKQIRLAICERRDAESTVEG